MAYSTVMFLKRMSLVIASIVLISLLLESAGVFSWVAVYVHSRNEGLQVLANEGQREVWIEIHDVSPGYGVNPLLEVIEVLDSHPDAYARAVLFVIPNHGEVTPLSNHPEFSELLRELEDKGYALGVHGYAHPVSLRGREFMVKATDANSLIISALNEFTAAGLEKPIFFAPPGWGASTEAADVLLENFQYVYYYYYIVSGSDIMAYPVHEYTWYTLNPGLWKAKFDYWRTPSVYRLSVHLGAVNSEKNLMFLDDFLSYVESVR